MKDRQHVDAIAALHTITGNAIFIPVKRVCQFLFGFRR